MGKLKLATSEEQSQSDSSSSTGSGPFGLLLRVLEGEEVSESDLEQVGSEETVTIPDEHLEDALHVGMLMMHKELTGLLQTIGLIVDKARVDSEADKEVRIIGPVGAMAALYAKKADAYCKTVDKALDDGLLDKHKTALTRFSRVYKPSVALCMKMFIARDYGDESDECVDALNGVPKLMKIAVESDKVLVKEARKYVNGLSKREQAFLDAASVGFHGRLMRAKRDAIVAAMGGTPEPEEMPS